MSYWTGGRGKGKAAMRASGRSNAVDLDFASNAENLTIMPVVSEDGVRWPPVVILPGDMQKYRVRPDGSKEILVDYLTTGTFVLHRTPASITKEYFIQWATKFIEQTKALREEHEYLLLTMDGFGAHLSYHALYMLQLNNIIPYALPAHTSHRTQVLDYSVFSPFKESLRWQWSMRVQGTQALHANDCYTLCEMVHNAYRKAVTQTNIIDGFHGCGLWSLKGGGVDHNVITESDLTNREENETGTDAYKRYQDLVKDFMKTRDVLQYDGPNFINGHFNSTSGSLCNRADLLEDLERHEEAREAEREAQEQRETEREERRLQREELALQAEQRRLIIQQQREERARERAAETARKAAEK